MARLGRDHDWSGDTRAVAVRLGGLIDGLLERIERLEAREQPQPPVAREQGRFPESEAGDAYREAVRRADEREMARDDYLREAEAALRERRVNGRAS